MEPQVAWVRLYTGQSQVWGPGHGPLWLFLVLARAVRSIGVGSADSRVSIG